MQKQTKPFVVEIKPSRKLKPGAPKPSIWGRLDLRPDEALPPEHQQTKGPVTAENDDRP